MPLSPWVRGVGRDSCLFKLHVGVATPQFKQASQRAKGAEQEWRKGIELPQRSGSGKQEIKRASLAMCNACVILGGDGGMMKVWV